MAATHTDKPNWRARFFWGAEMTYAIIGGAFEAYVYYAFTPRDAPDLLTITEATARACITQVMILLLGVAGVEIIRAHWHWFWKIPTFIFVQGIALVFAVVAFDLMRVAALAFRRPELLGNAADQGALWLPVVGTISTIDLIAGLPFYQVAVNWVAHIITKDRTPPTVEELEEARRRAVAEAELKAAQRSAQVGGLLATFHQVKAGLRDGATLDIAPAQSMDNASANLAPLPVQTLDIGDAASPAASGAKLPKGPWNSKALLAYIALEYPMVSLSDTQALETIKTLGDGRKKGTAYVATIGQCKAWALRTYGEPSSARSLHLVG